MAGRIVAAAWMESSLELPHRMARRMEPKRLATARVVDLVFNSIGLNVIAAHGARQTASPSAPDRCRERFRQATALDLFSSSPTQLPLLQVWFAGHGVHLCPGVSGQGYAHHAEPTLSAGAEEAALRTDAPVYETFGRMRSPM